MVSLGSKGKSVSICLPDEMPLSADSVAWSSLFPGRMSLEWAFFLSSSSGFIPLIVYSSSWSVTAAFPPLEGSSRSLALEFMVCVGSLFLTRYSGLVILPRPPFIFVGGSCHVKSLAKFFFVLATVRVTIVSNFSALSFSFWRIDGEISIFWSFSFIYSSFSCSYCDFFSVVVVVGVAAFKIADAEIGGDGGYYGWITVAACVLVELSGSSGLDCEGDASGPL